MFRRVLDWFAARFGADEGEESTDGRFVPSPLDASVRSAHGGGTDEIERELDTVSERARTLEEQRER